MARYHCSTPYILIIHIMNSDRNDLLLDRDTELRRYIREHHIGPAINIDFDPFLFTLVGYYYKSITTSPRLYLLLFFFHIQHWKQLSRFQRNLVLMVVAVLLVTLLIVLPSRNTPLLDDFSKNEVVGTIQIAPFKRPVSGTT